jgi:hypothetical protein
MPSRILNVDPASVRGIMQFYDMGLGTIADYSTKEEVTGQESSSAPQTIRHRPWGMS